jgi:hypothetical protein
MIRRETYCGDNDVRDSPERRAPLNARTAMQNEKATWIARSGTPVRAVMNLDKASMDRPLSRHLAMRCEVCGATGVKTFDTDSGRRCALDVVV